MIDSHFPSVKQNVAAVVQKAEETLKDHLEDSGTILYSSCATLTRGKYYFLGLNPGGTEEDTNNIRSSLEGLRTQTENAYLDQAWCKHPECKMCIGHHPLQENYKAFFTVLVEQLDSVCASNLIFKRSKGEKDAGGWDMAARCWPVHEEIIRIVQPSAIITFGKMPFDFIFGKRNGADLKVEDAGHGKWKWRASILETGEKLIGLPHLSRYALRYNSAVIDKVKKYLESA